MRKSRWFTLMIFGAWLSATVLNAQVADPDAAISETRASQETPVSTDGARPDEPVPDQTDSRAEKVYVPALNGTGLIPLDHSIHTRYLYGLNYSSGYDSDPIDLAKQTGSGTFLISPFFGAEADRGTVQYVLQYQPTFRKYTESQYGASSLQTASLRVTGSVDERWRWSVQGNGSHGQDSIRLLAPQQGVAVGDIPATGPGSASYRPDAGTITYVNGAVGMAYDATHRDAISLDITNAYSNYSNLAGTSLIATTTLAYSRSVTPKFQWIDYGQVSRYYGLIHCFTYGGGAGLEWKPTQHAYLHLSGGPQVSSAGCGKQQGYSYAADFSTRISQKSQIYLTSARQAASTYLGPGLWQKSVSVGFQHNFTKDQSLGVNYGYVGTTSLLALMGYSGTYLDTGYSYRFNHSINASVSYRRYSGDWTDASFTRNTALISVSWAPSSGHIFQ